MINKYPAGRGTEKSWSGDRQTEGLMQVSDELQRMTIGNFSFSDDGGSERPRAGVPDSCRETAGTVAPQAAEEGEQRSHASGDRMIRKTRPKPERRSTEHDPLNVGVAPHHGFKARALLREPFTTNPAHLFARTPPRRRMRRWGGRCARGDSGEGLGAP